MTDEVSCGYEATPDSDFASPRTCIREPIDGHDRCGWHAEIPGKSAREIHRLVRLERRTDEVVVDAYLTDISTNRDFDLSGIEFITPHFEEVDLYKANLEGTLWRGGEMRDVIFDGATLDDAEFRSLDLVDCSFDEINVITITFYRANVEGCSFASSTILDGRFERCVLRSNRFAPEKAKIRFERIETLNGCIFDGRFDKLEFEHVSAVRCQFICSDLSIAVFSQSHLDRCSFVRTRLVDVKFEDGQLTSLDLHRVEVSKRLRFRHEEIHSVEIRGGEFHDVVFSGEDRLEDLAIRGRVPEIYSLKIDALPAVHDCDLSGSNIDELELKSIILNKVNLEDTQLNSLHIHDSIARDGQMNRVSPETLSFVSTNFREWDALEIEVPPEAELKDVRINGGNWSGTDYSPRSLEGIVFKDVSLIGSSFTRMDSGQDTMFPSCDLSYSNLSEGEMFKANFRDATLFGANLSGTVLKESDLRGATLAWARLADTDLRDCRIDDDTKFDDKLVQEAESDWIIENPSSNATGIWGTLESKPLILPMKRAFGRRYSDGTVPESMAPHKADGGWQTTTDSGGLDGSVTIYRTLQRVYRENSYPDQAHEYRVRERHCRRKRFLTEGDQWNWFKSAVMRRVAGYGENYTPILKWSAVTILASALAYLVTGGIRYSENDGQLVKWTGTVIPSLFSRIPESVNEFLASLYFSVVTFTTLGYGDVQPVGSISKGVAALESLIGVVLMAILVFVFGRRATW